MDERVLDTVEDLVNHLKSLADEVPNLLERPLIWDSDGNTYPVTTNNIVLWDPVDPKGPIAIFDNHTYEEMK